MAHLVPRIALISLWLVASACPGDDDASSESGADSGTGSAPATGSGSDGSGPASTSGQSTDASDTEPACVPNYDPCGFENLCCPDMYCRSGDCLQCKPPGSPCDGTWLGSECCEGGCAMQPDGERICQ